jgi:mRNA interferase MazF
VAAPAPGVVVVVRFPFSDLSSSKFRPAVVLASAGNSDWLLCQVTSNAWSDPEAIELPQSAFASGGLHGTGYARPGKVFTAHASLVSGHAGVLTAAAHLAVVEAVIRLLQRSFLA